MAQERYGLELRDITEAALRAGPAGGLRSLHVGEMEDTDIPELLKAPYEYITKAGVQLRRGVPITVEVRKVSRGT